MDFRILEIGGFLRGFEDKHDERETNGEPETSIISSDFKNSALGGGFFCAVFLALWSAKWARAEWARAKWASRKPVGYLRGVGSDAHSPERPA